MSILYFARGLLPCNMLLENINFREITNTDIYIDVNIDTDTHCCISICETKKKKKTQTTKRKKWKNQQVSTICQARTGTKKKLQPDPTTPDWISSQHNSNTRKSKEPELQYHKQHTTKTREIKIKTTTTAEQQQWHKL